MPSQVLNKSVREESGCATARVPCWQGQADRTVIMEAAQVQVGRG